MKQLIIVKNHRERTVVCCPLCLWANLVENMGWLFCVFCCDIYCVFFPYRYFEMRQRFGCNPVFAPTHMSLCELVHLLIQRFPLIGTRKVRRQICLPIKNHLVYVDLLAAPWITDSDILTALALYELSLSSEIKRLPRWMAREIRRRARRIHFVSTGMAYAEARHISLLENIAISGSCPELASMLTSDTKVVGINRCLIWKGSVLFAKAFTARNLVRDKFDLALCMPPICNEAYALLAQKSPVLAELLYYMFAALDKRFPCFFYTKAGTRALIMLYAGIGLLRIIRKGRCLVVCLGKQVYCFWEGTEIPLSLKDAGQGDALGCSRRFPTFMLPDAQGISDGDSSRDTKALPLLSDGNQEGDGEGPSNTTADTATAASINSASHDANCGCKDCGQDKPSLARPMMRPVSVVQATDDQKESQQDVLGQNAQAADTEATKKASKKTKKRNANTIDVTDPGFYSEACEKELAASYMRATGAPMAPRFVPNAEALDNSKKSGTRREINSYHGQTPACSLEGIFEFYSTQFPGCYITDFVKGGKGENDRLYLHTISNEMKCSCCGKVARKERDGNVRHIQDIGIRNGHGMELMITLGRATCDNPDCSKYKHTFTEECSFAPLGKKHTTRVQHLALVMGASSSFHDTQRQMKMLGIDFGDDAIKSLLMSLEFSDETDVVTIGIDDVSIRKGQSYLTVIYNMENGHLLALLKGRAGSDFQRQFFEWMDRHPKVSIINRDRARSYGCYIDRYCHSHPDRKIIQVADRFHLLQNLSDHLHKSCYTQIPQHIALQVGNDGAVILDKIPNPVAVPVGGKPADLRDWKYDNTPATDDEGNPILLDVYLDKMSPKKKLEKRAKAKEKHDKICAVRKDFYEEYGGQFTYGQKKHLCKKYGISYQTVDHYLAMSEKDIEDLLKPCRPSRRQKLFDNYKNLVYKMLKDGHSIVDAFWYIKDAVGGWTQADSTLIEYIREVYITLYPDRPLPLMDELLRMEYPNQELVIDRSRLFYALMTFDEKKQDKELTPHLDMICEKYPVCELIRSTYKEFHDIIIVDKDINQRTPEKCEKAVKNLHAFIEKHKDDEVLKGFASGLKGDINCVINAICRRESSGGVEGRNTKYKQTLRDCYGHVQMETLEQKLKLGFMYTEKDFSFDKIAPWLMQEPFAAESA